MVNEMTFDMYSYYIQLLNFLCTCGMQNLKDVMFSKEKIGLSVIMNYDGTNAIVSNIHDRHLTDLGLVVGLRIVQVGGVNVEGWQHRQILNKISSLKTGPFVMTFKQVKFFCYCITTLN